MQYNSAPNKQYKYLWTLISAYVLVLLTADLYESKIINILWLHAGSGILLFSLRENQYETDVKIESSI